jgi:putative FmdB family regulatory protein
MPTYEYRCRDCGHSFDIIQKMSDDPLTHCPECGGELRKVFAPPAISFKGSGFYATDHAKKSKTSTSGEPAKKDTDTSSGGDTKSDTKSDTKKNAKGDSSSSSGSSSGATKKEGSS